MLLASLTTTLHIDSKFSWFYFAVVGGSAKTANENLHHKVEVTIIIVM